MHRRFLLALSLVLMCGCAAFEDRPNGPQTFFGPREQVFYAKYDEVWRAANLVLQPYPLRVSNMDQGLLETDTVRGFKVWTPPFRAMNASTPGESYKLTLKILRGKFSGRTATKVSILKDESEQKDFFSDAKPIPSDGLEEKTLLYRIGREIQIERALTKAQKIKNKQKS